MVRGLKAILKLRNFFARLEQWLVCFISMGALGLECSTSIEVDDHVAVEYVNTSEANTYISAEVVNLDIAY